jgi:hypothetical protein
MCETYKVRTGLQIQLAWHGNYPGGQWQELGGRYWDNMTAALGFPVMSGYTRKQGVEILSHCMWLL